MRHFNSIRRTSTERKNRNHISNITPHTEKVYGVPGNNNHSSLDKNGKFHPFGIVQRDTLVRDTKHHGVPYH